MGLGLKERRRRGMNQEKVSEEQPEQARLGTAGAPHGGLNACGARAAGDGVVLGPRTVLLLSIPQRQPMPKTGITNSAMALLVLSSLLLWRLP